MLPRLSKREGEIPPDGLDVTPVRIGYADLGIWRVESALRQDDYPVRYQSGEHGRREMFPDFVQAEAPGLAFGITAIGSHGGEMVIAIDDSGLAEVRATLGVSGDDERVQCKCD